MNDINTRQFVDVTWTVECANENETNLEVLNYLQNQAKTVDFGMARKLIPKYWLDSQAVAAE
jgi:hypothetical protein